MKRIASKSSYSNLRKKAQVDHTLPAGHPHDGQWFVGTWEDWTQGLNHLGWLLNFVETAISSMEQTNAEQQPKRFEMDRSGAERLEAAKEIKKALEVAYNNWQIDDPL
tara:strand:+ start:421 stop:744 length:324 start_codon:yes stop_codon:yes gene_type:complete